MNSVTLMGRLTRDPELTYNNSSGTAMVKFAIAVDKQLSRDKKQEMESKNQPTADFINIVGWGKLAESCANYTAKGKRVLIQGRIQTGSYEAQDGTRRYTTDVIASSVEFIDWKDRNDGGYSNNYSNANQRPQNNAPQNSQGGDDMDGGFFDGDFNPIDDSRIPF